MRRTGTAVALAGLLLTASGMPAAARDAGAGRDPKGFVTSERPQLVELLAGVQITPLLTAGDIIGGTQLGYQMTGTPDGLGAYRSTPETIELFMNHETSVADDDAADTRISHLTLDNAGEVIAAGYPVDGTEGLWEFCSATLFTLPSGVPWFFTGEEAPASPKNGTSIALNTISGRHVEMPWLGHMFHENNVPIDGLSKAVIFVAEDGDAGKSQIYAYFSDSFRDAIKGAGTLRTWVPDGGTDARPSPDDIAKGESLTGHFVTVPRARSLSPARLNALSEDAGSFNFVRIEDAVSDPANPGVVYFADTGASGREDLKGRIYRLTMDPAKPGRGATLEVVLDGNAGDDMFNPDNLGISDEALIIQEDRNFAPSGYNRVLRYNLATQTLVAVARTDPTQKAIDAEGGPAVWESSGVVDASALFGNGWWLLDVQAGETRVSQPGPSLRPNTAKAEGGQLLLVFIPNT